MNEQRKSKHQDREQRHLSAGIPLGAGFGVALGLVLMDIFDNPGFFAVGIALGLCLGMIIGLIMDRRKGQKDVSN